MALVAFQRQQRCQNMSSFIEDKHTISTLLALSLSLSTLQIATRQAVGQA